MKLTTQQIEHLYTFTRQHYVEWYDLQSELVDHLANAIETQWQENPKCSFDEALTIEFKKFCVFGFIDVVEKRKKYLSKKYYKLVLSNLKLFFSIPTILITVSLILIVFVLLIFFQKYIPLIQIIVAVLMIIFLFGLFINHKKIKQETQLSGKKWLLKDIIFNCGSMGCLINIPFQFVLKHIENLTIWFLFFMSFLIVLLALMEYVVLILIPSKSKEYLIQTYPQYELTTQD